MRALQFLGYMLAAAQPGLCFVNHAGFRSSTSMSTLLDASSYTPAALKEKFEGLKASLPADKDVVKCGGYYNLQMLSGNPKEELVELIVDKLKAAESKNKPSVEDEKIEALATLLYAEGKGFNSDLVDGDWVAVLSRQGNKSPKLQKLVSRGGSKGGFTLNTFDIHNMTFDGSVKVLKKGVVYSKVKVRAIRIKAICFTQPIVGQQRKIHILMLFLVQYSPSSEAYSTTSDGKIVLRRIGCDIIKATFKFWKLPTLSLSFLTKKGGYLDFLYLDKDIRITRGNKGGLFVHVRPNFLAEQLAQ